MSVKTLPLPRDVVARIHEIADRHGVRDVRLFGSHARGQAGAASDVDLLIRLEPGRLAGMRDRVVNDYFGVSLDIVWDVVRNHLPALKESLLKILPRA